MYELNVKPVVRYVTDEQNVHNASAFLDQHLERVLFMMNIELTYQSLRFVKDRARKAHKHFYGNSNLTDWRLRQMMQTDIILMMHRYTKLMKRN